MDDAGPLTIEMGVRLDGLTAVMLVVVCSVALLVQIYSRGYMAGDPGYRRYFAVMALFTAAMLGLVLADNLVMLFAFWELVGASSYLLIVSGFSGPARRRRRRKRSSSPGWATWACWRRCCSSTATPRP